MFERLDLKVALQALWRFKWVLVAMTLVGAISAYLWMLRVPDSYRATATFIPLDSSSDRLSSALASLGSLGGLAMQAGLGGRGGSQADRFLIILESRTYAENLIKHRNLMPLIYPGVDPASASFRGAVEVVRAMVHATVDPKNGLISLSASHEDPEAAARLVNDALLELDAYLQQSYLSGAQRNRKFLEHQVTETSAEVLRLGNALKDFQEQNKLVSVEAQTGATVQAYVALKSQLMAKEMQLKLLGSSAPSTDMQVVGLRLEIEQMRERLQVLESGTSSGMVSMKDAPRLTFRFAQLQRDLLVRQKLFELLTQQLELARIEETKETLSYQVIDTAVPPRGPAGPDRRKKAIYGALGALMAGMALALYLERGRILRPAA